MSKPKEIEIFLMNRDQILECMVQELILRPDKIAIQARESPFDLNLTIVWSFLNAAMGKTDRGEAIKYFKAANRLSKIISLLPGEKSVVDAICQDIMEDRPVPPSVKSIVTKMGLMGITPEEIEA